MRSLPLFPVTTVGSWPRPPAVLRAQRERERGSLSEEEFARVADAAVLDVLRFQEDAGVDIVTDGEQRRDNFYSFVAEKLDGVQMMTLAEMLDVVEDKAGFERILQSLDVPAFALRNPTCKGKIGRRQPLAADEVRFLKRHTDKPIKATLPGPYILTRAMFVPEVTRAHYATKEDLAIDVVRVLQEEIAELESVGVDFIQLDEPVLTELVFTQGRTRTFMCAALAASRDPTEELELAVSLINQVLDHVKGARTGVHVCRGNWSQDETKLLSGSYQPLVGVFDRLRTTQMVLEYATERAGEIVAIRNKELGLGVVNPRTTEIESEQAIEARIERALALYEPERIFLNPDCGFGTFSARPVNTVAIACRKIEAIVRVARAARDRMS